MTNMHDAAHEPGGRPGPAFWRRTLIPANRWCESGCTLQGEYIAPEKIEGVYSRSPFVAQAFVYGDSLKAQLVAVIVPDPDVLLPWAAERGLPADTDALCRDAAVAAAVLRSMHSEGQAAQLKGFEQARPAACTLTRIIVWGEIRFQAMSPGFRLFTSR